MGSADGIVHVFIDKPSNNDLKDAIADLLAAKATLDKRGLGHGSSGEEARRGGWIEVGTESDNEHVRRVRVAARHDGASLRIDRQHALVLEVDAGLGDVAVVEADTFRCGPTEHDVELREAEGEPLALVDEGDVDLLWHIL